MNEQEKRLIEAERRIASIESKLLTATRRITGVQGTIRNSAHNIANPFGSGDGGNLHRFSTAYEVYVAWTVEPTLKTAASANPTADGPALAETVANLATGFLCDRSTILTIYKSWGVNPFSTSLYQWIGYAFDSTVFYSFWSLAKSDASYYIDVNEDEYTPGDIDESLFGLNLDRFQIESSWTRRDGSGVATNTDTVRCRRTAASSYTFAYGPTYGESGEWSFAMECPETAYHTAGSGTIYLKWGTGVGSSVIGGGTPAGLPSDSFDGGTPDDLPADIIDGGTI